MGLEEDFEKLKGDPKFQRLASRLRTEPPGVVERLLECCVDIPELVPASPKEGKRFLAERDRVSVTIDSALLEMVVETAENLGVPVSRVVETAVWSSTSGPR